MPARQSIWPDTPRTQQSRRCGWQRPRLCGLRTYAPYRPSLGYPWQAETLDGWHPALDRADRHEPPDRGVPTAAHGGRGRHFPEGVHPGCEPIARLRHRQDIQVARLHEVIEEEIRLG